MDMIVFPILWSLLQTSTHTPITQWNPLTLQGAGLFHIAMGAVLGIAAMGRTQEKLAGANNGGISSSPSMPSTPSPAPAGGFSVPSFSSPTPAPAFKPTPIAPAATGLDPSDPPTRNTRNDF
jgi:hypothetical protein